MKRRGERPHEPPRVSGIPGRRDRRITDGSSEGFSPFSELFAYSGQRVALIVSAARVDVVADEASERVTDPVPFANL